MAYAGLAIEQMFEDIPNKVFDVVSTKHHSRDVGITMPPQKTETKRTKVKLSSSEMSKSSTSSSKSSNFLSALSKSRTTTATQGAASSKSSSRNFMSANSEPGSSKDNRKAVTPNQVKSQHRKSVVSAHDVGRGVAEKRMASATAVALYGDKLTGYERDEIMHYPFVYFLGGEANKKEPESRDRIDKVYDDEEHFYRVVIKDHVAYRYEVADKPFLGKGTFGQVIKAYDHKEDRWVALKLVRNEKIYLNQSKEELRILQMLRKQDTTGMYNVVTMYDFFMFRNHMVFTFELLGMNLYQVLKRNSYRGLSSAKILPIARGVLKCLELLFNNRLIHCDIKPENIMLRRNGDLTSVKVGDFGSSCYVQQQKYHYIQSRYYRAPEVILGLRYGPAIDMWSFGCVLGELAKGCPLLTGDDEDDQLAAIKESIGEVPAALLNKSKNPKKGAGGKGRGRPGSKPPLASVDASDGLKDCIRKVLVWDPEVRPTPKEMQMHSWLRTTSRRSSTAARPITSPSTLTSKDRREGTSSQGTTRKQSTASDRPGRTAPRETPATTKKETKDTKQGQASSDDGRKKIPQSLMRPNRPS